MSAPLPGAPNDAILRTVLDNGLTVLIRRDTSAPVVAIVTYVKAGYFDESDDVVGISHVLEHMYFKGTPTRRPGEIARETKAAGGYLNAGTIYDHTSYYTTLPASGFSAGLAVQADAFANSLIDASELERELEVIIEEESRKRDTPGAVAAEECYALLHDVHRMRRWRIGMPERLRQITRADVDRFYRAHYVPSNTVLTVVGDVDPAIALAEIIALYGGLAPGTPPSDRGLSEPARSGFRWRELVRDVGDARLVFGWRTVPPVHADAPALDTAAGLLGAGRASRLYREVRERSLVSSVGAYHFTPTELGVFVISGEVPPDRLPAATSAIWAEVRALSEHAPSAEEVARVQRGIESRWLRRLESMDGQANYLAAWEAAGGWELGAAYLESLLSVTPAQVRDAATRYLTLDLAAVVSLRSSATPTLGADVDAVRATLERAPRANAHPPELTTHANPASAVQVRSPDRVEHDVAVFESDGGIPILVRRKPGAPIAHVEAMFLGGVNHETADVAGYTTLLARTAVQGTARRDGPQLAIDVESLGGTIGNVVGVEGFGWTLSLPTAQLSAGLDVLAEIVQDPSFPEHPLSVERTAALAGLAHLRDDMSRQPVRLALSATFGDHPYGRPLLGTEASVERCDGDALVAWHDRFVRRGHGVIVVVADAPVEQIAANVRHAFSRLRQHARTEPPRISWPTDPRERTESRDKAQTGIAMLLPAPARTDRARRAASLLATIASGLGGRFFQALRDREALAYSVTLGARALSDTGWFVSYLGCAPGKEAAARSGLLREWQRLATEPVTSEELERAKAYTLGSLALRQQSSASVLADISDAWLFSTLDELVNERLEIAAITADELLAVARDSFDVNRAVWGAVRGAAIAR